MGYPTSVPAFASKNSGDVVQAAHINDLQTEVTAIANGLLNGIAHPQVLSSGLTVSTGNTILGQNLDVAGNSTFHGSMVISSGLTVSTGATVIGGSLQVNGNSTFAGSVNITGTLTLIPDVYKCVLTHSTLTPVAAGGTVIPSWDTETAATAGMHSTASNSSRITFAPSTGWWRVGATLPLNTASSGIFTIRLRLNDTSGIAYQPNYTPTAGVTDLNVETLVRAQSTADYVTVAATVSAASTNSISHNSTFTRLQFYAHFVSK